MKPTNLDIKDSACLHVVHILKHPTSCPTTRSTQNTPVNALKKNLSPLPSGKYSKSTEKSTRHRHQANNGKSCLEGDRVQALGAMCSLQSEKKLLVDKRLEMRICSNEGKEKSIEDYVDRKTPVARKRVQDAETVIMQKQEHIKNVEKAQSTTTKPDTTFKRMLNAIGDSLSDLSTSDDEEDGEDKDDDEEDSKLGKLSKDDEPGWMMGTISKTVQRCMESFRPNQIRLHILMQPGWGEAADYFCERYTKYGTTELIVPAVVEPQTDTTPVTPSPTTFAELLQGYDIVLGQSQMPRVTSPHGSSQMRLGSEIRQADNIIVSLMPDAVPNWLQRVIATPAQPVSFDHRI